MSGGFPRALKLAVSGVVLAIGLLTAADMIRLHPYEYIFFNRSFGGVRAALGRYETDYWGVSHKEGVDWLIANYKLTAPPRSIRVANTAADYQTSYYLDENRESAPRFVPGRQAGESGCDALDYTIRRSPAVSRGEFCTSFGEWIRPCSM
jgi:hypothetical protein